MDKLIDIGCKAFATHYHYLLKAQNFHWNVTGLDFLQYHELFGEIYEEIEEHVDEFAEQLRAVCADIPAGFAYLQEYSVLEDPEKGLSKDEMVYSLYKDTSKVIRTINDAYNSAELEGEHGLSAFLSERLANIKKHAWQLYSSMPV
jgi:starvation-inducible DNA-binding protein